MVLHQAHILAEPIGLDRLTEEGEEEGRGRGRGEGGRGEEEGETEEEKVVFMKLGWKYG